MKQHTVTTYSFDELSEAAKEKALTKLYDINVDNDWYEFCYDDFHEKLKEVGLKAKTFYFSLDRDNFFEASGLCIVDHKKFISAATKIRHAKWVELSLDKQGYKHQSYTGVPNEYDAILDRHPRYKNLCYSVASECDYFLNNLLSSFLSQLSTEYDYQTSKEAVIETIKCNEYEFTADGNLY